MTNEKRRIQRVVLSTPVEANLSGFGVMLLDISSSGARVEHAFPVKAGRKMRLIFENDGSPISIECEVVRCRLQKSSISPGKIAYQTGLRFSDPAEEGRGEIRKLIADLVTRGMAVQTSYPASPAGS
jgi:hypothetical protein